MAFALFPPDTEMSSAELLIGVTAASVLMFFDVRYRKIPNVALVALGIALVVVCGIEKGEILAIPILDSDLKLVAGGFGCMIALGLWQHQILGGGDVKFLVVVSVFCPMLAFPLIAFALFIAAGFGLICFLLKVQKQIGKSASHFDSSTEQGIPMMPFFVLAHLFIHFAF